MNQSDTSPATAELPSRKPAAPSKKPVASYQRHGFTGILRGRSKANARQLDGRSALGRALAEWKGELIHALGGIEHISPQERVLVETCARDYVILSSIDAWLMTQPSLVNSRKRSAYAIVLQRVSLAESLQRRLQALGLKKRTPPAKTLATLLNGKEPS